MAFRLILWFHCRMYCLIYIIDCRFGEPRCSLHFRGGMSGKFEPAIKKWMGRSVILGGGLVRGFGVEDFFLRAPLSKSVTEQPCCCLVSCFLVPGETARSIQSRSVEVRCFICFFFYFIACAHVGARADHFAIFEIPLL
jgi:hypothetical protein